LRNVLIVAFFMLLAGCASTSPEAERVRVTNNPDVVHQCKFLGNVHASSGWGGLAGSLGEADVETDLRQKTADLKGDTVYIVNASSNRGGARGIGEAYRCGTEATSTPK